MTDLGDPVVRPTKHLSPKEICGLIDDLPADAVGELYVEDDAHRCVGVVFIERSRICWAAAPGLSRRLTDLLRGRVHAGAQTLEEVFLSCQSTKVPFGETLVASGMLTAAELRDVLRTHTAESLVAMAGGCRSRWVNRSERSYDAKFSFTTAEILAEIDSRSLSELSALALETLATELGERGAGIGFIRDAAHGSPRPIARWGDVETANHLVGKWAAGVIDLTGAIAGEPRLLVYAGPTGDATVVWCEQALLFVGVLDARALARLMSRRAQRVVHKGTK